MMMLAASVQMPLSIVCISQFRVISAFGFKMLLSTSLNEKDLESAQFSSGLSFSFPFSILVSEVVFRINKKEA